MRKKRSGEGATFGTKGIHVGTSDDTYAHVLSLRKRLEQVVKRAVPEHAVHATQDLETGQWRRPAEANARRRSR